MNFDFDDTQYALRDMARDLFVRESPPSRVRELWDGKPFDRSVWRTMASSGISGLTVPEEFGGSGADEIDLTLVYEQAGRSALPEPLLETTGVAAPLIAEAGTAEIKERWLGPIAAGEALVAVRAPGEEHVAWAGEADLLICEEEGEIHAVPRESYTAKALASLDPARPIAAVEASLSSDTKLCDDGPAWARAKLRGAFGTACLLHGISMNLLERTLSYVKDRKQFGRPVGSFQAVKHKLATMHQAIQTSRPAAWYAGYAIARGSSDAAESASVAKAAAAETEALCNGEALQCHGGIGFTWEDDLHLWLKRGLALRAHWGSASDHRRLLAPRLMEEL